MATDSVPCILDDTAIHKPFLLDYVMALRQTYEQQQYDQTVGQLIAFLKWLKEQRTQPFCSEETQYLRVMLKMITIILRDPAITIPPHHLEEVIASSEVFAKAFILCQLPPPDDVVSELAGIPSKSAEMLLCCSSHSQLEFNLDQLAQDVPLQVSLWWSSMTKQAKPVLTETRRNRVLKWLTNPSILSNYLYVADADPNNMIGGFFDITYIDDQVQDVVKRTLNERVVKYHDLALPNRPSKQDISENRNFKTILIISDLFRYQHAVYRSLAPLLYSLKSHYRLAFINHAKPEETPEDRGIDTDLFDDIYRCDSLQSLITTVTEEIRPGIIFFPDISMTVLSILLSNLRLAPIQCTGYGHPVSSFATEVDYFITSADAEDHDKAPDYYSEKLVLIPGVAALPVPPKCDVSHTDLPQDPIRISLAWGNPKINRAFLESLKPILERTDTLCHFYISGIYFTDLHYLYVQKELETILPPSRFRIMRQLKSADYFPFIEQCHFGIDSYHFGGYNRIIDSLYCGRPILAFEGDRIYNRAASTLLRQLGLDELVATNEQELIKKAVRLVDDHSYRTELSDRIRALDMMPILERQNPVDGYRYAMDAMIADYHAGTLSDRRPIIIEQDGDKEWWTRGDSNA